MILDVDKAKGLWPPTSDGPWMTEAYEPGLVSVIVPTYNRARFVTDAMDSVWAQTYRPIELIVVDDGSTDSTADVLDRWRREHAHDDQFTLRIFRQSNRGAQAARNLGAMEARGEYFQFLDSDDLLLPVKLERQTAALGRSGVDYCYARSELRLVDGTVKRMLGTPVPPAGFWITRHAWHTSSPLFRRTVCVQVGPWDEQLRGCQEYEYAARVKAAAFPGEFVDEVLDVARIHGGLAITNQANYGAAIEAAAIRIAAMLDALDGPVAQYEYNRLARNLVAAGLRYVRDGSPGDARRVLRLAAHIGRFPMRGLCLMLCALTHVCPVRVLLEGVRLVARQHWGHSYR